MLAFLFLCCLTDDIAAPPGTVMPNKDELFKTFREHFAKYREPLDNFVRRQTYPGKTEGHLEGFVQINGDYCKASTKDSLGVERLTILSPKQLFRVVKVTYEGVSTWKFNSQETPDEERRKQIRRSLLNEANMSDFGDHWWGFSNLVADPPTVNLTQVTVERTQGLPVYRFHFKPDGGGARAATCTVDVAPSKSWVILLVTVHYNDWPEGNRQGSEFFYEGQVHGRPALRRVHFRVVNHPPGGERQITGERITEVVEYAEQTTFDPAEYELSRYLQNPVEESTPYLAYVAVAITVVLILVFLYALSILRRQRSARAWAASEM